MAHDTKEKILQAALDLFSSRGYAGVGTKAIAEAAGVNEVTLFRAFGSKENLWLEVFHRYLVRVEDLNLPGAPDPSPGAAIETLSRAIAALLAANGKMVRMSLREMALFPTADEVLRSQPLQLVTLVTERLEPWADRLTLAPGALAKTLVATLFGTVLHLDSPGGEPILLTVDQWLAAFLPVFQGGAVRHD